MKYNIWPSAGLAMFLAMFLCSCGDNGADSGQINTSGVTKTSGEINAVKKEDGTITPSPEEIFKELKSLVDYSRGPDDTRPYAAKVNFNFQLDNYLVNETLKFNECTLVSEKIWRSAVTTKAVDLTTPASKQAIMRYAWKMNLDEVDAEKTDALRSSKLILVRGAVFDYLHTYNKKSGWRTTGDLEFIPVFNRKSWSPNYSGQTVKSSQHRSGEFELGLAYPEDQKEIQEAFDKLVRECQRPEVIAKRQAEEARKQALTEEKIVGKWGLSKTGLVAIEFLPNPDALIYERGGTAVASTGTWTVENDVIKLEEPCAPTELFLKMQGDVLNIILDPEDTSGIWLVRQDDAAVPSKAEDKFVGKWGMSKTGPVEVEFLPNPDALVYWGEGRETGTWTVEKDVIIVELPCTPDELLLKIEGDVLKHILDFEQHLSLRLVRLDDAAVPSKAEDKKVELTPGQQGIARDLLAAYENNLRTINLVADNADYAVLAWAAYGKRDALDLAKERGWTPLPLEEKNYLKSLLKGGDTVAMLFTSDKGKTVLAFRGTVPTNLGDWYTNIKGTLSAKDLDNVQIEGARKIAREVAAQHNDVVFVGHSLGGRMARVARLATGKAAVTFNTAPLGVNDRLKALGNASEPRASLTSFKSPEDPLSSLFSPGDIEISNIATVEGGGLTDAVNFNYTHSMAVIAQAMQAVRLARDEGWVVAR